jgi:hypothetical protein
MFGGDNFALISTFLWTFLSICEHADNFDDFAHLTVCLRHCLYIHHVVVDIVRVVQLQGVDGVGVDILQSLKTYHITYGQSETVAVCGVGACVGGGVRGRRT